MFVVLDSHQIVRWKLWSDWSASPQSEPTSAGCWRRQSGGRGDPARHTGHTSSRGRQAAHLNTSTPTQRVPPDLGVGQLGSDQTANQKPPSLGPEKKSSKCHFIPSLKLNVLLVKFTMLRMKCP